MTWGTLKVPGDGTAGVRGAESALLGAVHVGEGSVGVRGVGAVAYGWSSERPSPGVWAGGQECWRVAGTGAEVGRPSKQRLARRRGGVANLLRNRRGN